MASTSGVAGVHVNPQRDWKPRLTLQNALGILLLLVLLVFVVYPVVLIILQSFQVTRPGEAVVFGLDGWRAVFSERGLGSAALNTLGLTIARQGLSLPVAIMIAWLIARTDLP